MNGSVVTTKIAMTVFAVANCQIGNYTFNFFLVSFGVFWLLAFTWRKRNRLEMDSKDCKR